MEPGSDRAVGAVTATDSRAKGTVYLHVGAMKSGTTYLQRVLVENKQQLTRRGVLFPGRRWNEQVHAAEDLVGRRPSGKPADKGSWDRLVNQIVEHDGPVVVSMETFASARSKHARRALHDLGDRRVRIIVTARDAGRVIPAQWQEWVQNRGTVKFGTFLRLASTLRWRYAPVARRLWWSQDIARILRTWGAFVAPNDVVLVTVPTDSSDPTLLWRRFCEAIELDPAGFDLDVQSNESLGVASVELMRRVNKTARRRREPWQVMGQVKHRLGKTVLAQRRNCEPRLRIPDSYRDFAANTAQRFVADIERAHPVVIGDLADLRPESALASTTNDALPEDTSDEVLLDAALDGVLGLTRMLAGTD